MNYTDIFEKLENKGVKVSEETLMRIKTIFGLDNSIDDTYGFYSDPIEYINAHFPDEISLVNLDNEILKIGTEISKIDASIEKQIESICHMPEISLEKIDDAVNNMSGLVSKIEELNRQAKNSEETVIEITKDIKQLEHAKKNISHCITVLHHYHICSQGISDLRTSMNGQNVKKIFNMLNSLLAIQETLIEFHDVPQIEHLLNELEQLKNEIKIMIVKIFENECHREFNEMEFIDAEKMSYITLLADKIFFIKNEMKEIFVNKILDEYIFGFIENPHNSTLDHIDKRYNWLKNQLKSYDQVYNLWFPYSWEVDLALAKTFCTITEKNLSDLINLNVNELDPRTFLTAMQRTIAFEQFLTSNFSHSDQPVNFQGVITHVFHDHIHIYIDFQDKNLSTLISNNVMIVQKEGLMSLIKNTQKIERDNDERIITMTEGTKPEENFNPILLVASDLFMFYKRCLIQFTKMQCLAYLDRLISIFKKYLAEFVSNILDTPMNRSLTKVSFDKVIPIDRIKIYCSIIATSTYCLETVEQLEDKLSELVSGNKSQEFSFIEIKDMLNGTLMQSIKIMTSLMDQSLEPMFNAFLKINFSTYEAVGDQSVYVNILCQLLTLNVPIMRNCLKVPDIAYEKLMINFYEFFLTKYTEKIFSIKSITSAGVEQLLLDSHILKKFFITLPAVGAEDQHKSYQAYVHIVKNRMKELEIMLKLVITPHKPFEEFFDKYISLVAEPTLENFKKIVEMKSLKKHESTLLLEGYNMINQKS